MRVGLFCLTDEDLGASRELKLLLLHLLVREGMGFELECLAFQHLALFPSYPYLQPTTLP